MGSGYCALPGDEGWLDLVTNGLVSLGFNIYFNKEFYGSFIYRFHCFIFRFVPAFPETS